MSVNNNTEGAYCYVLITKKVVRNTTMLVYTDIACLAHPQTTLADV
jgi:hypothetical protein